MIDQNKRYIDAILQGCYPVGTSTLQDAVLWWINETEDAIEMWKGTARRTTSAVEYHYAMDTISDLNARLEMLATIRYSQSLA